MKKILFIVLCLGCFLSIGLIKPKASNTLLNPSYSFVSPANITDYGSFLILDFSGVPTEERTLAIRYLFNPYGYTGTQYNYMCTMCNNSYELRDVSSNTTFSAVSIYSGSIANYDTNYQIYRLNSGASGVLPDIKNTLNLTESPVNTINTYLYHFTGTSNTFIFWFNNYITNNTSFINSYSQNNFKTILEQNSKAFNNFSSFSGLLNEEYYRGYNEGYDQIKNLKPGIPGVIQVIVDAPFRFFRNAFSFSINGFPLGALILGFTFVGVAWFIWRKVAH